MKKTIGLAVLGGDKRQVSMVAYLAEAGYRVSTWGLPHTDLSPQAHPSKDWESALESANVVILPLPASRDGVRLFSPLLDESVLRLDILLQFLHEKVVIGGRIPEHFLTACEANGIQCIDFFDSEILQLKNALPTAEGAIEIAMRELPVVLDGVKATVVGYGRIGELLAQKLCALGVKVTVAARRKEVLTRAALSHCKTLHLEGESTKSLSHIDPDTRMIFNTVPCRLFTRSVLTQISKKCVLIDLASAPGGIDMEAADALGIRAVWGNALPGKYAPESAGIILAQTVESILDNFHFE